MFKTFCDLCKEEITPDDLFILKATNDKDLLQETYHLHFNCFYLNSPKLAEIIKEELNY